MPVFLQIVAFSLLTDGSDKRKASLELFILLLERSCIVLYFVPSLDDLSARELHMLILYLLLVRIPYETGRWVLSHYRYICTRDVFLICTYISYHIISYIFIYLGFLE